MEGRIHRSFDFPFYVFLLRRLRFLLFIQMQQATLYYAKEDTAVMLHQKDD